MDKLQLRTKETDTAISVMQEVAAWYRDHGAMVWKEEWLTREALITEEAKEENFYTGYLGDECACAFILQWKDHEYWPQAPEQVAAYIHKLCVRHEFTHQQMTKQIVECVKEECRKRGVKYIRLDSNLAKKKIRQLYLGVGFKIVKILDYENGQSMALYEMEV